MVACGKNWRKMIKISNDLTYLGKNCSKKIIEYKRGCRDNYVQKGNNSLQRVIMEIVMKNGSLIKGFLVGGILQVI